MMISFGQTHLLILQDDTGRREFTLTEPRYILGRDLLCSICLVSKFVSRHHAVVEQICQADGTFSYRISDSDGKGGRSANGMLINGRKLRSHLLVNEDVVTFGPGIFVRYYTLLQRRDVNIDGSSPTQPRGFEP
jgi:pSer/pThr/pTyr-binding forkhead associated (FHA) protein